MLEYLKSLLLSMTRRIESEELTDYIVGQLSHVGVSSHLVSCKRLSFVSTIMMEQNKSNLTGDDYVISSRIRRMFVTAPVHQLPTMEASGILDGIDPITTTKLALFGDQEARNVS